MECFIGIGVGISAETFYCKVVYFSISKLIYSPHILSVIIIYEGAYLVKIESFESPIMYQPVMNIIIIFNNIYSVKIK